MMSMPMSASSSRDSISLRPSAPPFQPGSSKIPPHQVKLHPLDLPLDHSGRGEPLMRIMPPIYPGTNANAVPFDSYHLGKAFSPAAIFPPTPMSQLSVSPLGSGMTSPMRISPSTSPIELLSSAHMSRNLSDSQRGKFIGDYMNKGGCARRRGGSPIQPFQMRHHNSKPSISINANALSINLASQKIKRKAIVRLPELDSDSDESIDIITEQEDEEAVDATQADRIRPRKSRSKWPIIFPQDFLFKSLSQEPMPFPFDCLQSYEELRDLNAPLDGLPDYIDICLPIEHGWEELRSLFRQERLQQREGEAKTYADEEEESTMIDDVLEDTQSTALGLLHHSMHMQDASWKELGRGFGYDVTEEATDADASHHERVYSNTTLNGRQDGDEGHLHNGRRSNKLQTRDNGERGDEEEDEENNKRKQLNKIDSSEEGDSDHETSDGESEIEEYSNPSDEEEARQARLQRRNGNFQAIEDDGDERMHRFGGNDLFDGDEAEVGTSRRYSFAARGPLDDPAPMLSRSTSLQSTRGSRLHPDASPFAPRGLLGSHFGTDKSVSNQGHDRSGNLNATAPSFTPGPAALAALSKAAKMPTSPINTLVSSQDDAKDMQGREKRQRRNMEAKKEGAEGEADFSTLEGFTKALSSSSISGQTTLKPTAPPFYPPSEVVIDRSHSEKPVLFKVGGDDSRDASPMVLSKSLPQTQTKSKDESESVVGDSALQLSRSLSSRSPESRRNNLVSSILHSARSSMSSIRRDASLSKLQQRRRSSGMELDKFGKSLMVKKDESDDGSVSDIIEEIGERVDLALEGWASRILDEMLIIGQVRPASMVTLDPSEKQSIVDVIREGVLDILTPQLTELRDHVGGESRAVSNHNTSEDIASMISPLLRHQEDFKGMMQKLLEEQGGRQNVLDKVPSMMDAKLDLFMATSIAIKDSNEAIIAKLDRMQVPESAPKDGVTMDPQHLNRLESEISELRRQLGQAKSELDGERMQLSASSKEIEAMRVERDQSRARLGQMEREMMALGEQMSEKRDHAELMEQRSNEAEMKRRELEMILRNGEEQRSFLRERLDELTKEVSDDREDRRREREIAAQALEETLSSRRDIEQSLLHERQRGAQLEQMEKEARLAVEMHLEKAAKAEGQVLALEKRVNEQDVKITNLQQLTATQKQKAAQAGQKLAEVEKRAKDASDFEKELVATRTRMAEIEARLRDQIALEQRLISSQEIETRLREDLTTTQARFLEIERELSLTKENKVDRGLLDELTLKLTSSLEEVSSLHNQLEEAQRKNAEIKSTTSSPAKRIIRLKRPSQGSRSIRQENSLNESTHSAMHGSSTWASIHAGGSSTDEMDPTRRPISPADDSYESVHIGNSRSISCLSTSRIVEVDDNGWWS